MGCLFKLINLETHDRSCNLRMGVPHLQNMCSLKLKLLSILIPKKTSELLDCVDLATSLVCLVGFWTCISFLLSGQFFVFSKLCQKLKVSLCSVGCLLSVCFQASHLSSASNFKNKIYYSILLQSNTPCPSVANC